MVWVGLSCLLAMLGALTKMSSARAEVLLVSFSSAIVINGSSVGVGATEFCGRSRNGLPATGFVVDEDADGGAGSSKGEAGLFGSGEPARLRNGLLLERFRVKPGEG